uniref:Serpin domain-containing protein n=1 Tax=Romanomermis culicivorax TaxID=13658 RepID=A0A915HPT2_ROMCU
SPVNNTNAKFTADLWHLLSKENAGENFVFSPVSLELLLLNASQDYTTEKATLKYATVLAIDKCFPVTERFTSITKKQFPDAKFFNAAFSRDGKKTEAYINHVVAETTKNRIKNLIPNGSLGAHTTMVLVNALYLKASFKENFTSTAIADFYDKDNKAHEIEFLEGSFEDLPYYNKDGFSMIMLPYIDEHFNLYVAINSSGSINMADVIHQTLAQKIDFESKEVDVKLPKFTMEYTADQIMDHMKMLNVRDIFNESTANFKALLKNPKDKVFVSTMRHKAFIETVSPFVESTKYSKIATARATKTIKCWT